MKPSQVFRKSAQRIENGRNSFSCVAIGYVAWDSQTKTTENFDLESTCKKMFTEYFKPEGTQDDVQWFGDECTPEEQEHRVTSLLLMAEIAESEGL